MLLRIDTSLERNLPIFKILSAMQKKKKKKNFY